MKSFKQEVKSFLRVVQKEQAKRNKLLETKSERWHDSITAQKNEVIDETIEELNQSLQTAIVDLGIKMKI